MGAAGAREGVGWEVGCWVRWDLFWQVFVIVRFVYPNIYLASELEDLRLFTGLFVVSRVTQDPIQFNHGKDNR